jgi:pilus assembly protein CpaB
MNRNALTLALAMAGIAVFFVYSYVSSIEEDAKKRFGTEVLVLVARRDISEMETINETALELKTVPKRFLEPSAISFEKKAEDKDSSKSLKEFAGSVAMVPIRKGEQITFNKVTEPSMKTGLSPQVAPGRRAISVPVSETTGVSKLVKPGDRVDVIAVLDGGGGKETKISKVVLQDVIILSVGRFVTNNVPRVIESDGGRERVRPLIEDSSFASVTLEVEPAQAQEVALLTADGDTTLVLALRNNDDTERNAYPSTMLADVLGPDAARVQRGGQARR